MTTYKRVGGYAIRYVDLCSELGWDAKRKMLVWLRTHFSKPLGSWEPVSQRLGSNTACIRLARFSNTHLCLNLYITATLNLLKNTHGKKLLEVGDFVVTCCRSTRSAVGGAGDCRLPANSDADLFGVSVSGWRRSDKSNIVLAFVFLYFNNNFYFIQCINVVSPYFTLVQDYYRFT